MTLAVLQSSGTSPGSKGLRKIISGSGEMSSASSFSTLGVNLSGLCDLLGLRSLSSLVIPFRVMSMSSSIGCWFSSVGISEVLENSSQVTSSLLENTD